MDLVKRECEDILKQTRESAEKQFHEMVELYNESREKVFGGKKFSNSFASIVVTMNEIKFLRLKFEEGEKINKWTHLFILLIIKPERIIREISDTQISFLKRIYIYIIYIS